LVEYRLLIGECYAPDQIVYKILAIFTLPTWMTTHHLSYRHYRASKIWIPIYVWATAANVITTLKTDDICGFSCMQGSCFLFPMNRKVIH
jgi:hypothetical protein